MSATKLITTEASKVFAMPVGSVTGNHVGGADIGKVHWATSRAKGKFQWAAQPV